MFVKVSLVDVGGEVVTHAYFNADQIGVLHQHPLMPGVTVVSIAGTATFNVKGTPEELLLQAGAEVMDLSAPAEPEEEKEPWLGPGGDGGRPY